MLRGAKNLGTNTEETSRRFYTTQHPFSCGIALHARPMSVCILNQAGEILVHRNMTATPEALLQAIAPARAQSGLAAAWLLPWSWRADCCAAHGRPFVLGHALSLQAMPGGKAKNEKMDAQKIAGLRRGGLLPQASVSPAERRAPRALLRRRLPLARKRGALLAHVHTTTRQYPRPALGTKRASTAHRAGGAARCAAPAVPQSLEVDLALSGYDDALLRDGERPIVTTAKHHAAQTVYVRQTVPGIGTILRLVRRDDMPDSARFPRVQACASYGRGGTWATESAGQRSGTSGSTRGNAPLTGAFSEAAV